MNKQEALFNYTLRLADNGLILSQRLSEWTGHGPFLEEDLALTNIALDILGQSRSLLEYASQVEGKGRTEDDLAFLRGEREFFSSLMVEQPNGDYAKTIARQFLIDAFDYYFYSALSKSKDETLAGIAAKSVKEIMYHLRHTTSWMVRFGDGTEDSHERLQNAINDLWRYTGELFETTEVDEVLLKDGIAVDMTPIKASWEKHITEVFTDAKVQIPDNKYMQRGSREGKHTEHLGYILAEMQYLPRAIPGAKW
ncbi:MAG: 1,2-phenylacetyl-CoA epoxidase subunit PaaC [Chitinophagaceae bacterium]